MNIEETEDISTQSMQQSNTSIDTTTLNVMFEDNPTSTQYVSAENKRIHAAQNLNNISPSQDGDS